MTESTPDIVTQAGWNSMDTAPLDGTEVLLLAHGMVVQARFCPGEWSEDTPIWPAEYSGAVWSCFDDEFQFEVEEWEDCNLYGPVKGWLPLDRLAHQPDAQAIRDAALDEAAYKCRSFLVGDPRNGVFLRKPTAEECAAAIEALIGTKP